MAGGNPLAPPGGAPVGGGPLVPQGPGAGRTPQVGRSPFDGAGAPILAPAPPGNGQGNSMGVPASKAGQPFADVHQNLKVAQNQYRDGIKAQQVLDHLRVELDQLMEKGDLVRPEDVIEAAGRLVGHGIGASQLAQIMSDMPAQGGEGLAGWVRMHDVTVSQAEQQLAMQNNVIQHRMGVAAVRSIAASHLDHQSYLPSMPDAPEPSMPGVGGMPGGGVNDLGGGGDAQ